MVPNRIGAFIKNNLQTLAGKEFEWAGFYHGDLVYPDGVVNKIVSNDGFKTPPPNKLSYGDEYGAFTRNVFNATKLDLCTGSQMYWWRGSYDDMRGCEDKHSINLAVNTVLAGVNRVTPVPAFSREDKINYIEKIIRQSEGEYYGSDSRYFKNPNWNKVAEIAYDVVGMFENNGNYLTHPEHLLNALEVFHKEMKNKGLYKDFLGNYNLDRYSSLQWRDQANVLRVFEAAWAACQLFNSKDISDFELCGETKVAA